MARKTTVVAFWKWIADEVNEREVLERLTRAPLHTVAREVKQPFTCLYEHFHATPEAQARYQSAKKAWIELRKGTLVEKVDVLPADKDEVARLDLEAKIIDNQAKAYHRERWGEKVQVERGGEAPADAALIGFAAELLKLVAKPKERVVNPEMPALPEPVERG